MISSKYKNAVAIVIVYLTFVIARDDIKELVINCLVEIHTFFHVPVPKMEHELKNLSNRKCAENGLLHLKDSGENYELKKNEFKYGDKFYLSFKDLFDFNSIRSPFTFCTDSCLGILPIVGERCVGQLENFGAPYEKVKPLLYAFYKVDYQSYKSKKILNFLIGSNSILNYMDEIIKLVRTIDNGVNPTTFCKEEAKAKFQIDKKNKINDSYDVELYVEEKEIIESSEEKEKKRFLRHLEITCLKELYNFFKFKELPTKQELYSFTSWLCVRNGIYYLKKSGDEYEKSKIKFPAGIKYYLALLDIIDTDEMRSPLEFCITEASRPMGIPGLPCLETVTSFKGECLEELRVFGNKKSKQEPLKYALYEIAAKDYGLNRPIRKYMNDIMETFKTKYTSTPVKFCTEEAQANLQTYMETQKKNSHKVFTDIEVQSDVSKESVCKKDVNKGYVSYKNVSKEDFDGRVESYTDSSESSSDDSDDIYNN